MRSVATTSREESALIGLNEAAFVRVFETGPHIYISVLSLN